MINEGCLDGVEEIYAFHNRPNFDECDVRVIPGPIMAQATIVKIKILGKGGHGSVPHLVTDVISAGASILTSLHSIKSRSVDSKDNVIFTITQFTSGYTYNVFPDEAFMQSTIRSFNKSSLATVKERIVQICQSTASAFGCKADV